jgi:DNA polymerase (family 10)
VQVSRCSRASRSDDGSLDLHDEILAQLDLIVGAVHSRFDQPRRKQTERILRAMDNPFFSILAHPTDRLIGEREAMDIDIGRIVHHARERGCFLELDADPRRPDLNDTTCRMAKDDDVLVAISSDAHSADGLDNAAYGITQAHRGWLAPADMLNTPPLEQLKQLLAAARLR